MDAGVNKIIIVIDPVTTTGSKIIKITMNYLSNNQIFQYMCEFFLLQTYWT